MYHSSNAMYQMNSCCAVLCRSMVCLCNLNCTLQKESIDENKKQYLTSARDSTSPKEIEGAGGLPVEYLLAVSLFFTFLKAYFEPMYTPFSDSKESPIGFVG